METRRVRDRSAEREQRWSAAKERAGKLAETSEREPFELVPYEPPLTDDEYATYLRSPEWKAKRDLVIQRSGGICEGCGQAKATQVHHLTYSHRGRELLWQLRAVCRACHTRAHERRR